MQKKQLLPLGRWCVQAIAPTTVLPRVFFLSLGLFSTGVLQAQSGSSPVSADASASKSISGKVLNEEGQPLEGVSVLARGTQAVALTDASGAFQLSLPAGARRLVFSAVGFETQEADAVRNTLIAIRLKRRDTALNEVVVVGYGTQGKKGFTGAAARINQKAIKDIPVQSFDQALSGKAAGVSVAIPNGVLNNPPVIRIRGVNSISLSSYPLVVIDGIPVNTGDISSNTSVPNNPLSILNPSDIESIDVLKDAASTAIYGSRGAAGILLITTKKGTVGKVRTNYDAWVGFSKDTRFPDVLKAQQYMDLKNEAVLNAKILGGNENNASVRPALYFPSYNADGSLVDTDWKEVIYRTGVSHNHALSVSGGSQSTNYYFSANFSNQQSFLVGNDFERLGLRANIDHKVNDWLTIVLNSTYNKSDNRSYNSGSLPGTTMSTTGAGRLAIALPPNVAAYNADGAYNINNTGGQLGSGANLLSFPLFNPVAVFDLNRNTSASDRFLGRISANVRLLKQLQFSTTFAYDQIKNEDVAYKSPTFGSDAYSTLGSIANTASTRENQAWTNTLTYEDRFVDHHLNVLVGNDIQKYDNSIWGIRGTGASDDFFEYIQGGWANIATGGGSIGERVFASFFSRLTYDFKGRYFLTGNFRRDGNSALAAGKKYGNFGGVSAGWVLSEEGFFERSSLSNIFSQVKLTGSWGRVGNGNLTNDFGSYGLYNASLYGAAPTWALSQIGNPALSWETSEQTNIGLNLGILNNRVQVELAYFNNNVNGLVLNTPLSPSMGIPGNAILSNIGSLYNRGIEFSVNANILRNKDLSWDVAFNYTNIRNKVTALANGEDIVGYTASNLNNTNITRVGQSVGTLYGAISAGVNPANGRRIFINSKGEQVQYSFVVAPGENNWTYLDGKKAEAITATDFVPLGNALPKWYGGITNNISYKNFDASFTFTYAGGNYIMNGTKTTLRDQIFFNNSTDMLRRWTKAGDVTDIPRVVYNDRISNGTQFSISENVEKGDFARLQNVVIGYRVPTSLLSRVKLSSLRVYAQATNAFLITGYTGADPEISTNGNNNTTPGVEFNSVGQARTITFGINVGF
ncbi:SusC/RagA family TonB-linked outer membrane protein [Paraflavitalea pollutisoli]|uniref:SusC/RagA family TonB-linked outer membrane protein n=1 Tax=Paraflavitalea pollutisoli TaxID=3034143 RepID=UPI0023EDC058|nr:TonB-dependent receptor [Paraflavitalea sp. H1-2-19X]